MTLRSAVLAGVLFFPPTAYFTSSLLCKGFPSSYDPPRLSSLCLTYASVFLSCQTLCWLLYLPPSLCFLSTHTFSLILSPFIYPLLRLSFYFSSSVPFFIPCLSVSFLTSHFSSLPYSAFLLTLFRHSAPLVIVLLRPFSLHLQRDIV